MKVQGGDEGAPDYLLALPQKEKRCQGRMALTYRKGARDNLANRLPLKLLVVSKRCFQGSSLSSLSGDFPLSSNCAKMNRNCIASGVSLKTATIPSLRVEPVLRRAAEEVLRDGESLSGFVESAVRAQIQQRQQQAAFIARGLASRDQAKASGVYFSSGAVLKKLEARLAKAKKASA